MQISVKIKSKILFLLSIHLDTTTPWYVVWKNCVARSTFRFSNLKLEYSRKKLIGFEPAQNFRSLTTLKFELFTSWIVTLISIRRQIYI